MPNQNLSQPPSSSNARAKLFKSTIAHCSLLSVGMNRNQSYSIASVQKDFGLSSLGKSLPGDCTAWKSSAGSWALHAKAFTTVPSFHRSLINQGAYCIGGPIMLGEQPYPPVFSLQRSDGNNAQHKMINIWPSGLAWVLRGLSMSCIFHVDCP